MKAEFGSVFQSPFPLDDSNKGLAAISARFTETAPIPTVSKPRPTATVPQPMVRLVGLTNRQSLLDAFIGEQSTTGEGHSEGHIGRDALQSAGRYMESWIARNSHDENAGRKALAALAVLRAHEETEEVLFVLRNAVISV